MLQRMEKNGFILRKSDTADQRVTRVFLTDLGRSVQDEVETIWKKMEQDAFSTFAMDERTMLRLFLIQIRDNLSAATGETPWEIEPIEENISMSSAPLKEIK